MNLRSMLSGYIIIITNHSINGTKLIIDVYTNGFFFWFDTINLGWLIVYIEGYHVSISK